MRTVSGNDTQVEIMKASKNPIVRRLTRAVVAGTVLAATMAVTALPALADTTEVGEGNSPGSAADQGRALCYYYTNYNSTSVLRIWRYQTDRGETRYKAEVRCYDS